MSEEQELHTNDPLVEVEPEAVEMNYVQSLDWSQGIRRRIVAKKLQNGVPSDNDEIKILLSTLKDHDSTAISDRRNRIDESTSQSSAEIALAMVEMVKQQANQNPFAVRTVDGSPVKAVGANSGALLKINEAKLGDHDLVDGEGEIGTIQETCETFFGRMGVDLNKKEE